MNLIQLIRAILFISVPIALAGCSDEVRSSYATIAAAKEDIKRGWVPSVLPSSTVQIRESHDLDTNIGHGTFSFSAEDAAQFKSALTPVPLGEKISRVRIPREQMEREGYSFYSHGDFYIAVDWTLRRGEFWLTHSP